MPTDPDTIGSYDTYAKEWAERMRSGNNIAHEYLEKPAMRDKIPDLEGKSVLCLGCGTGEECAYLRSLGAARIVGVDISKGLIEYARKSYPDIEFQVMDMEQLSLPDGTFDLVYSSLVMHYVDSWESVLTAVSKVLKPGGKFLFSTHHPALWGAERARTDKDRTSYLGYRKFTETDTCEIAGDYLNTRKIDDVWFGDFKVTYYHRSMEKVMKDILKSDLEIVDFLEPKAVDACKDVDPVFWEVRQKIPLFMIFELRKK